MRLGSAIFLVSAAGLVFQVAQTRLFSATMGYHLTYLVISVALLGVGAGATAATLFDGRRRPPNSTLPASLAAAVLLALFAETQVDPVTHGVGAAVAVAYVLGALPLLFASWLVVRALRESPSASGALYAADLAGAACGGLLGYVAISPLGVQALYGLAALLGGTGAVLLARPRTALGRALRVAPAAAGVVALVGLTLWGETLAPPRPGPSKAVEAFAPGVAHEAARWDPLARVDVFRFSDPPSAYGFLMDPGYAGPRPAALSMLLDLSATTPILNVASGEREVLGASILSAPYELVDRPSVLVIGPGGGVDIHTALLHGSRAITSVEVNRTVVDLMRGRYATYSGGPYLEGRVRIAEDEARSFVRRSVDRYDLIVMTVVDSWAALASGSYALTESYLYTAEAFEDYARHLTAGGVLSVGRWYREPPVEMLRTAQVAAAGLRRVGIADPAGHLLVLRHGSFGLLLARADGFDSAAVARVRRFADDHRFTIAYDPLAPGPPFAAALSHGDVPASDDHPFFFMTDAEGNGAAVPVAYTILFVALLTAFALSYVVVLAPLRRRVRSLDAVRRGATLQALAIGLGFIAAEIVVLQRLTLYLGQPALALSLGLAALLGGAGLGSALSTRLPGGVREAALASGFGLLLAMFTLGWIAEATLSWSLEARAATAVLVTAAIGVPLGTVFPRIVRLVGGRDPRLVPWVWAVNGSASVIGSILAVALAMQIGFTAVALAAAACYLAMSLARD